MRNNILLLLLSCFVIFSPQFVVAQEQEQTPPATDPILQEERFFRSWSVAGY